MRFPYVLFCSRISLLVIDVLEFPNFIYIYIYVCVCFSLYVPNCSRCVSNLKKWKTIRIRRRNHQKRKNVSRFLDFPNLSLACCLDFLAFSNFRQLSLNFLQLSPPFSRTSSDFLSNFHLTPWGPGAPQGFSNFHLNPWGPAHSENAPRRRRAEERFPRFLGNPGVTN